MDAPSEIQARQIESGAAHVEGSPLDHAGQRWPADYPKAGVPDKIALICDDRSLTFGELDRSASAVAAFLLAGKVRAGDRVAYLGRNSEFYFSVLFGCMRARVVLVPLNWRCTPNELSFIIADAGAAAIICDNDLRSLAEASAPGSTMMVIDGPDGLRHQLADFPPMTDWVVDPDLLAMLMFTSGTTGKPKGVVITQRMFGDARQGELTSSDYGLWTGDDVLLSPMPNFHMAACSWVQCGVSRGLTTVITGDASPANVLALCRKFDVTCTFIVPTVVRAVIDEMARQGVDLPALREVHYGAAPMDVDLLHRSMEAIGCGFVHHYGMTEAAGTTTRLAAAEHDVARPHLLRSVGKPVPGLALQIRRPDRSVAAIGEAGEIWIRSSTVTQHYWNRPDASAEVLIDGWYRSGDGGYIDAEGYLFLTDRIKDMIVTGGENVYPVEVEAALRQHPAVADIAVFGLPDERWGEIVAAAVELRAGAECAADDLVAFGRTLIAGYKVPRTFFFDQPLPRTATGKVQRASARRSALERGD